MLWLIAIISAYLIFSLTGLIDRYLVRGPIPGPKVYAFYVGILSIFVLFLIPLGLVIPSVLDIALSFSAGVFYIFSLFGLYWALKKFEASRIIPSIGGILPLFTFGLSYFFFRQNFSLGLGEVLSFILLVSGSVLISYKKGSTSFKSFQVSLAVAFLASLYLILSKMVYLEQPFWSGFIWIKMGGFLTGLGFLGFREVREEIFKKRVSFKLKTVRVLVSNQSLGAAGIILQNWAVFLAPVSLLAFINALEGIKYVFLLLLTILFSLKLPGLIKEDISKKVLFQKLIAILLICLGLTALIISQKVL